MRIGPRREEAAAVADRVAGDDLLHRDQPAGQRHRRPQAELRRRLHARRAAVQHDAGTDPVARPVRHAAGRPPELHIDSGASRPAAASRVAPHLLGHRHGRIRLIVGIGEMRHQHDLADAGQCRAAAHSAAATSSGRKPSRFIPVFIFRCTSMRFRSGNASSIASCSRQCTTVSSAMRGNCFEILPVEESFQQQHRLPPPQFAQAHRGIGLDQRHAVGGMRSRAAHWRGRGRRHSP